MNFLFITLFIYFLIQLFISYNLIQIIPLFYYIGRSLNIFELEDYEDMIDVSQLIYIYILF
jgi:hypothetical protein